MSLRTLCRPIVVCVIAVAPSLVLGQAVWKPGRDVDYAINGGARLDTGSTKLLASAGIGGEAGRATADAKWRIGGKAVWSRVVTGETRSELTTLQFLQESQHRWTSRMWLRQRLSFEPALHSTDPIRGSVDLGIAVAVTRFVHLDLGVARRYDSAAGWKSGELRLATGVALKLD